MQILNNYNFSYGNYNKVSFESKPKFSGNQIKPAGNKSFLPKALAVMIPLCILAKKCNTEDRISCKADRENYNVEYFNVKESTKDKIEQALTDFEKKSKTIDFIDGLSIAVAKKYQDLDDKNSFRRQLKSIEDNENSCGSSFFSDGAIPNNLCLQESAHSALSSNNSISFTLMHEFGHQFDSFYGHDKNAKFVLEREAMLSRMAQKDSALVYQTPTERADIIAELNYLDNNSLSDKSGFKEALLKDLKDISVIKNSGNGELAKNIDYYISRINFKNEINKDVVDLHGFCRSEVYANLFAYAVGENDGDKETFTSNFSNCYEVVKNDVQKYLGIK